MKQKAFLALLLLINFSMLSAQTEGEDRIVKVLSFNILHGSTTQGNFDLDVLANVIKKADPDFVALQEVDFKVNRSRKYDLVTELGWRTKMVPLFGKAMAYDGGEYGEGILSKYSFVQTRNVPLPYLDQEEPRAALEVVAIIPSGDTVAFVGTHFSHEGAQGRLIQAQHVNTAFASNIYPTVLAGDLNATPGSPAINTLEKMWNATYDKQDPQPTYPSHEPTEKIDYVMYAPANRWEVLEKKVIRDTLASDHCAYLVTLRLSKK